MGKRKARGTTTALGPDNMWETLGSHRVLVPALRVRAGRSLPCREVWGPSFQPGREQPPFLRTGMLKLKTEPEARLPLT